MAGKRDITIYKGDTYVHQVTVKNNANTAINISGRTYLAQLRKAPGSSNVIASFTTQITDAANGVFTFSLASSNTANIEAGSYFFDVQETNGSVVLTLMYGDATVTGDISRVG